MLGFILAAELQARSVKDEVPGDTLGTTILTDAPGVLHNLLIGLQPLYGEAARSGSHAGFGFDVLYRFHNRLDVRFQFRKPWSARLFDQTRDDALRNSNTSNSLVAYSYAETGLALHFFDRRTIEILSVPLKERGFKGAVWGRSDDLNAKVPATRRTLTSLRAGYSVRRGVADVSEALRIQGSLNASVLLPETFTDTDGITRPFRIFSSGWQSFFYAGISRSVIRNFSVGFDHYAVTSRDASLTFFADVLLGASNSIENARYNGLEFPLDVLEYNRTGMRVGLDLNFDRDLGYALGWEAGIRPGIAGTGAYTQIKISFPVFGRYLGQQKLLQRQGTAQP